MKTYYPSEKEIKSSWLLIDAADIPLGRLASNVSTLLQGKHKPIYVPTAVVGDHVVVINAARIKYDNKKATQTYHYRHSGYPGGLKKKSYEEIFNEDPSVLVKQVVKGMLPKNKLGKKMLENLKVYNDDKHNHAGQKPVLRKVK
jgi:large subunit ribosomal protein L13